MSNQEAHKLTEMGCSHCYHYKLQLCVSCCGMPKLSAGKCSIACLQAFWKPMHYERGSKTSQKVSYSSVTGGYWVKISCKALHIKK